MKVEIQKSDEQKELIYPLLMESEIGSIALFKSKLDGVFICPITDKNLLGASVNPFANWTPFNGKITLSNQ
jgi:hypothetical protein